MKLTDKDIQQLASLMKLELSEQEIKKFQNEISSILDFIGKLKEVSIEGIPEVGQVTGESNNWRADKKMASEASPEDLLQAAPEQKDGFFKVPGVFKHE